MNFLAATTSEIPNRKKVEFNKKSKKSKKKMKLASTKENISCLVKMNKVEEEEDVYEISSGDEDCSRGMKSMHHCKNIISFI